MHDFSLRRDEVMKSHDTYFYRTTWALYIVAVQLKNGIMAYLAESWDLKATLKVPRDRGQ